MSEFRITREYILKLNIRKICRKCSAKNTVKSINCRVCKSVKLRFTKQKRTKKHK